MTRSKGTFMRIKVPFRTPARTAAQCDNIVRQRDQSEPGEERSYGICASDKGIWGK